MGFGLPAAMGVQAAFPDKLVVDIDGDGSFVMNIQELATVKCENLPVKMIVLNNQHLGMVVQWEDRFHAGNRGHTYLGPVDHPEYTGQGQGDLPEETYPDFVDDRPGASASPRGRSADKADVVPALKEMIAHPGAVRARHPRPLPGARPADDPGGGDGQGDHQELMGRPPAEPALEDLLPPIIHGLASPTAPPRLADLGGDVLGDGPARHPRRGRSRLSLAGSPRDAGPCPRGIIPTPTWPSTMPSSVSLPTTLTPRAVRLFR